MLDWAKSRALPVLGEKQAPGRPNQKAASPRAQKKFPAARRTHTRTHARPFGCLCRPDDKGRVDHDYVNETIDPADEASGRRELLYCTVQCPETFRGGLAHSSTGTVASFPGARETGTCRWTRASIDRGLRGKEKKWTKKFSQSRAAHWVLAEPAKILQRWLTAASLDEAASASISGDGHGHGHGHARPHAP